MQRDIELEGGPVGICAIVKTAAIQILAHGLRHGGLGHQLGRVADGQHLGHTRLRPTQAQRPDIRQIGEIHDPGNHLDKGFPILTGANGQTRRMGQV